MTYEASVRNYRRVVTADLVLGVGVTLVSGRNGNGKTSLAEAIRSALTMDPLPCLGDVEAKRSKKAAKDLVHSDADRGSVVLSSKDGSSQVTWPACDTKSTGRGGPKASPLAAGLRDQSLVSLDAKERFAALRAILNADPTFNDFLAWLRRPVKGLPPPDISEDLARKVWASIEKDGWVNAQEHARKVGIGLQEQYKDLTGGKWGSEKGETWRPDGWDLRWDNMPVEGFRAAVDTAEAAMVAAIGTAAVDLEKRRAVKAVADTMPQAQTVLAAIQKDIEIKKAEIAAHEKECAAFVDPGVQQTCACPHCGKDVAVVYERGNGGGRPIFTLKNPPPAMSDDAIKEARKKAAVLDGKGQKLKDDLNHLIYRLLPDAEKSVKAAETAAADLAEMPEPNGAAPEVIETAQADRDNAKRVLSMVESVDKARGLHRRILQNQHVQAALSDTGVRAAALAGALAGFNADLAAYAEISGLGAVVIDPDTASITVGGRPYRDLSGAEGKVRVRALLQLAMAKRDGSDMIVVDVEESTDRKNILALIKMLNQSEMPALMVCHMNHPSDAPDLGSEAARSKGYRGVTYWIESGVVAPIAEAIKAAA